MKYIKFSFIFTTFLLLVVNITLLASDPLLILTEEWPPYNYLEDGVLKGLSYEIVQYITNDLKANYEIQVLPSSRTTKTLDTGGRNMLFSLFRTPEREKKYKWIGPISSDSFYFYKKKGSPLIINTLEDAKKVNKIATRSTGLVYRYLRDHGFNNLDTSINNTSIYLKVILGRNDLAIGESAVGVAYILKKLGHPSDILEKTSLNILSYDLYIAASKDISDSEILLWQNSLDKMKESGEYQKIYEKYMH